MNQADTVQSTEAFEGPNKMDRNAWKVIAVVMFGPFMAQMDSTVVNVSLSTISESLHSSVSLAQWTISGYLLALALMLPVNGWLVDRVGAMRLYLGSFVAFTLSSILCGAARDMDELIAARIIQGIAGGLLAPLTQLMMTHGWREETWSRSWVTRGFQCLWRRYAAPFLPERLAPVVRLSPFVFSGFFSHSSAFICSIFLWSQHTGDRVNQHT